MSTYFLFSIVSSGNFVWSGGQDFAPTQRVRVEHILEPGVQGGLGGSVPFRDQREQQFPIGRAGEGFIRFDSFTGFNEGKKDIFLIKVYLMVC